MNKIQIVSDLKGCSNIWKEVISEKSIFDSWEFRECFNKNFKRPPYFIISENKGKVNWFLPMSYIEEEGNYTHFPGETWNGKTWLEGNRIAFKNSKHKKEIFNYLKKKGIKYHLRYLIYPLLAKFNEIDETGYLFFPKQFNYDLNNYFKTFSHKSRQTLKKELCKLEEKGVSFRFNSLKDFDLMIKWNIQRYKENSYFYDSRFLNSFKDVLNFLHKNNFLWLTTILIGGEPAAIDLGCLFKNQYTILAGGTNEKFPGVAKLINIYHMHKVCEEHISKVDFLCGDFSWKKLFHLTPRPLYLLSNISFSPR